ncbi:MAG: hypothetical protein U9N40_09850 [Euryarchaeota archaeon]|nr:hypothetical protein [Euryarchaeota archaeon]
MQSMEEHGILMDTVLLVDDNETLTDIFTECLEICTYCRVIRTVIPSKILLDETRQV